MSLDYFDNVFDEFIKERQDHVLGLFDRYRGPYVGEIVDTNDPLNMHRVRIKVPELHDYDINDEDCPWARQAPWFGGAQCGSWVSFSIGDQVFVAFEKNHPYSIIYWAAADATRRAKYSLDSVYTESPMNLTEDAEVDEEAPEDYEKDWLPLDHRPMSMGFKDRYGSCFITKAVGFFPTAHSKEPTPPGVDPVNNRDINFQEGKQPKKNEPDAKHMALYTKYGNTIILSDVGYDWKRSGSNGEFIGEWKEDRDFERKRSKYLTKLHTEEEYKDRDQRRLEMRTRYGHLLEMRDVGWNKTRPQEYDDGQRIIGTNKIGEDDVDHRWLKIRTKGGHLFQMYDKGFDQENDNLIKKRQEENEFGEFMDQESKRNFSGPFGPGFWHDREDARFVRIVSRYGYKLAIDDRGTDNTQAESKVSPYGNGFIIKGRRSGRDQKDRGFGIEFNEKDKLQHLMLYSPKSKVVEINDKYDYIMLSTDTYNADGKTEAPYHISESMVKRADNEFSTKIAMANLDGRGDIDLENGSGSSAINYNPEIQTHHLKLDQLNAYVRLKTHYKPGIPAGIESRCGSAGGGTGNNWTEIVDHQDRGLWFTNDMKRHVLRSQTFGMSPSSEPMMWQTYDEQDQQILIVNNGKLTQIYCNANVQVIAGRTISLDAGQDITLKAGGSIKMQADSNISFRSSGNVISNGGGAQWVTGGGRNGSNVPINAPTINADNPGKAQVTSGSSTGKWKVGISTPDGASAPSVQKSQKKTIDSYKPNGINTQSYNIDRAQNKITTYEAVVRKNDIWGE